MFQEDEFTKGCQELDEPDVSGWELFCDTNGVKIYRLYNEVGSTSVCLQMELWSFILITLCLLMLLQFLLCMCPSGHVQSFVYVCLSVCLHLDKV